MAWKKGLSSLLFALVATAFLGSQNKSIKASSRMRPLPKCDFPIVYGGPSDPNVVANHSYHTRRPDGSGTLSYVKRSVQTSYNDTGSVCLIDRVLHNKNGTSELAGPVLVDFNCDNYVDEIRIDRYAGCVRKGNCPPPSPGFSYFRVKRSSGKLKGCFALGDRDMRYNNWLFLKKP